MKIVVNKSVIIATHTNEQLIEDSYPGSEIFTVPNGQFKLGQTIPFSVLQLLRGATVQPSTISRLDFFNRFTPTEMGIIYSLAKTNIQVEIMLDQMKMAEFIDLRDQRTIQAVQFLEASGILAQGRSVEILNP